MCFSPLHMLSLRFLRLPAFLIKKGAILSQPQDLHPMTNSIESTLPSSQCLVCPSRAECTGNVCKMAMGIWSEQKKREKYCRKRWAVFGCERAKCSSGTSTSGLRQSVSKSLDCLSPKTEWTSQGPCEEQIRKHR